MNRSCKFCKFRYEQQGFEGVIHMCDMDEKQTTLDDYCIYFSEIRTWAIRNTQGGRQ